jgi:hypothetical protein
MCHGKVISKEDGMVESKIKQEDEDAKRARGRAIDCNCVSLYGAKSK